MKISTFHYFYLITTACIATLSLFICGFNWIYHGYGINPYIAFPLAGIIYIIAAHLVITKVLKCIKPVHPRYINDDLFI